jgi:hypothetical protein
VVKYCVSGSDFSLESDVCRDKGLEPGTSVVVLCRPDQPATAHLELDYDLFSKPLMRFGAAGTVACLFGALSSWK